MGSRPVLVAQDTAREHILLALFSLHVVLEVALLEPYARLASLSRTIFHVNLGNEKSASNLLQQLQTIPCNPNPCAVWVAYPAMDSD
jgi:hypothetical protein